MKEKFVKIKYSYTLLGFTIGLIFPILATLNELIFHQFDFSWNSIKEIHNHTLLRIIDIAPFFLGIFGYLAGDRQAKLSAQTEELEELVKQRSRDVIRQKLFYEALVDNSPIAIVTLDHNYEIISINPAFEKLFGYRQDELMGKDLDELIANPEKPQEAHIITQTVWEGDAIHEFGKRRRKDGKLVDVEIFGEQIRVNNSRIGVLGLYRDITQEKKAQEALSASEERFRRMFSDSPVALRMEDYSVIKTWLDENVENKDHTLEEYLDINPEIFEELSRKAKIIDLNEAALWLFGAKDKEDLQNNLHTIINIESRKEIINIINALRRGKTTLERELIYNRLDGKKVYSITKLSVTPGYEKNWGRILFSNMDITERKMAEERLAYLSLHDIMTGIYNRAFFEEEMSRLSRSRIRPISILVTDMDNLKAINDNHGHSAGDKALKTVADIVKGCFRSEDVVARIGGDEIAVLLPGLDANGAVNAKARILKKFEKHNSQNTSVQLNLSIGHATTEKGSELKKIFKQADKLMYEEKKIKKKTAKKK